MGIELILIAVGTVVTQALAGAGVILTAALAAVGGTALATGAAALAGTGGAIGVATNPFIANGFNSASADTYNNTIIGMSNVVKDLNLPFIPPMHIN